MGDKTDILRLT